MSEGLSSTPSSATIATELAMRRTGMAFQRTRMAADRTLMGVIRTSLSLISFGFTIYQFFGKLRIGMLILGIIYHVMFMLGLRRQRDALKAQDLVHGESGFPASLVLVVAVTLLLIGLAAAFSMIGHVGPFD